MKQAIENFLLFCLILFSFCKAESTKKQETRNKKQETRNKKQEKSKENHSETTLLVEKKSQVPFKVEVLVEDLGVPWGMAFLNEEELIWTEREGKIKKIHIPTRQITEISGGPIVYAKGTSGLLDLVLHPEFKTNKWIYFTYTKRKKGKQSTALAKGEFRGNKITKLETLFVAKPLLHTNKHHGSRLVFDSKGFLFMTTGDRNVRNSAQRLNNHHGKLLRLNEKGKAALGNPFSKIRGAKAEIWSFGHRNPQGLFIHPETKKLWLQEHGPKGGDEINLIKKGRNYGWPVISYGKSYLGFKIGEGTQKKGMEQPIKHFTPSIAPGGLLIYSGKKFPQWKGDFFSGSLTLSHLNKLKIRGKKVLEEKRMLSSLSFRFRHVIEGPKGFIYVTVDQGKILKISPL